MDKLSWNFQKNIYIYDMGIITEILRENNNMQQFLKLIGKKLG